ncbi:MAG: ABC transporter permease [Dehalococcoidales bacterium]|nr:ABC transporter permease [Dehalococcoidales bacterium]
MTAYIIRRIIIGLIVLLLVTMLVFLLVRLLPGDPLVVFLGQSFTQMQQRITTAEYEALKHQWGLDRPLYIQYVDWLGKALRGDLGRSIKVNEKISTLIAERMPRTIYIGLVTLLFSSISGILVGIICALRRGTWLDNTLTTIANIGMVIPVFWLAILLMYLFSYKLRWLPTSGWVNPFDDFWGHVKCMIMPFLSMAVGSVAGLARIVRSCMLEVIAADYIRTAWAKGLRERIIVMRHQMKNAMIPVVTMLGGSLVGVMGGSIFIETIFAIPGIGLLTTRAIFDQDYQVVQATVLLFGLVIIMSNLLVDIIWAWMDPRIRYA